MHNTPPSPLVLQAFLNCHYSYQLGQMSCQLRSAVTCVVFKKAMLTSTVDMTLFSSGALLRSAVPPPPHATVLLLVSSRAQHLL